MLPLREVAYEIVSSPIPLDRHNGRDHVVCPMGGFLAASARMTGQSMRSLLTTLMWIGFGAVALAVVLLS